MREAIGLIWERAECIVYTAAFKPVLSNFPIPILILNLSTSPDTDFQSESLSLILVGKIDFRIMYAFHFHLNWSIGPQILQ